jgi:hypothetical protein
MDAPPGRRFPSLRHAPKGVLAGGSCYSRLTPSMRKSGCLSLWPPRLEPGRAISANLSSLGEQRGPRAFQHRDRVLPANVGEVEQEFIERITGLQ